jgi:hypothetical protein
MHWGVLASIIDNILRVNFEILVRVGWERSLDVA